MRWWKGLVGVEDDDAVVDCGGMCVCTMLVGCVLRCVGVNLFVYVE